MEGLAVQSISSQLGGVVETMVFLTYCPLQISNARVVAITVNRSLDRSAAVSVDGVISQSGLQRKWKGPERDRNFCRLL